MLNDFIGFTFNGKHCIRDFNIYRTSDGSRYNDNLVPSMTDKAVDVPGGDGQYYFYTQHKTRQFSISIAFDNLSEEKYRKMRTWLDGKGIYELIFDEAPYKVYSAKSTGTPQLKTLCFDKGGKRVYKGEGTLQFTCYYPYAHTPTKDLNGDPIDGRVFNAYDDSIYPNKNEWKVASQLPETKDNINHGDLPAPFIVDYPETIEAGTTLTVANNSITLVEDIYGLKWDSKTGLVLGKKTSDTEYVPVPYTGKSFGAIPVNDVAAIYLQKKGEEVLTSLDSQYLNFQYWYY